MVSCAAVDAMAAWPAGRACRNDSITIDFPLQHFTVNDLTGINPPLAQWMTGDLVVAVQAWLDQANLAHRVRVEPVFAGAGPGRRAYRLRHWRLVLSNGFGRPVPLWVKRCDLLTYINTQVGRRVGRRPGQPDSVFVGRECDIVGQSDRYHDSMGIQPVDLASRDTPLGQGNVALALLDAPISVADASTLKARVVEPAPRGGTAVHAFAMGAFARQVAPDARMTFYRALDGDAGTPISRTAQALERALMDHGHALKPGPLAPGGQGPLVINLSLGWPPEYNAFDERLAAGAAADAPLPLPPVPDENELCREAPTGQSVFTMLALIRDLRAADAPVMVFAAAGNRAVPELPYPADPAEWPRFYPAQWGRGWTGWEDAEAELPPVVAVERTAATQMGLLDALGRGVEFAAPGVAVRVPIHSAAVSLPVAMTGTSVATALMSGAAARLAEEAGATMTAQQWITKLQGSSRLCNQVRMPWFGQGSGPCPAAGFGSGTTVAGVGPTVPVTASFDRLNMQSVAVKVPSGAGVDRWAAGSATPQPFDPVCPTNNCALHIPPHLVSQPQLTLELDVAVGPLPDARLELQWSTGGRVVARSLSLGTLTVTSQPQTFTISGAGAVPADASIQLTYLTSTAGKPPVRQTVWLEKTQ